MTGRAQDAEPLQPTAQLGPGLAALRRQPVAERPVRVAEPEALDQLRRAQPPLLEVRERLRALLERLVVVGDDLVEQLGVVLVLLDR